MKIAQNKRDSNNSCGQWAAIWFACGLVAGAQIAFFQGFGLPLESDFDNSSTRVVSTILTEQQHLPFPNNDDSWRTVHVFKGEQTKLPPPEASEKIARKQLKYVENAVDEWSANLFKSPADGYYSQTRQDFVVASLLKFKPGGYFIDLAAHHAYRISNTYALEQKFGWTGICIEANSAFWEDLARMRNCHVVAAAVGNENGQEIAFRFEIPGKSNGNGGLVGAEFDNKPGKSDTVESVIPTITLYDVLQKFQAPREIQYLSLDVEGAELFIMEKFPFDQYIFQLLTVERPNPELIRLLRKAGYRFVKKLVGFGDMLFAHESILPELDLVSIGIDKPYDQLDRGEVQHLSDWKKMTSG